MNLFFTGKRMLRGKIACPMGKDITVKAGLLVGREVGPQGSVIRFCTEFLYGGLLITCGVSSLR